MHGETMKLEENDLIVLLVFYYVSIWNRRSAYIVLL